jgi:endonuclease/exonuclease/phosphatase family metal-dependent hydrolase
MLKLATWNVNGIRARHAEVLEWIDRERPDVICLQELKATPDQVPITLCTMEGYWCYWHGARSYSGVALHVSKALAPARPDFSHPAFDVETRIATVEVATATGPLTVASIYVPNGGKDFVAKMAFLEAMDSRGTFHRGSPSHARSPRHPRIQVGTPARLDIRRFKSRRPLASTFADSSRGGRGEWPAVRQSATAHPRAASRPAPSRYRVEP